LEQISLAAPDRAAEPILKNRLQLIVAAMRPYQWTKNLFVLGPLLFGMRLGDAQSVKNAVTASLCFCFLSSSLYLINDIIDAKSDRAHPEKRNRPIASGALSIGLALCVVVLLMAIAYSSAAFLLGPRFLSLALVYTVITLTYCLTLKRAIVLDGMLIAGGFVVRVVGGAVAIGVEPSHWLIVCAFLLALFLAFTKRRQELLMLSDQASQHRQVLGQYTVDFLDRANNILLGATIVCYALYTVAPDTVQRFGTDKLLYGTTFVLYGLLRYLALQQHLDNGGNPTKMLIKDKPLLLTVVGWAIFNALIIYRVHLILP